jgi:hypothetical protein
MALNSHLQPWPVYWVLTYIPKMSPGHLHLDALQGSKTFYNKNSWFFSPFQYLLSYKPSLLFSVNGSTNYPDRWLRQNSYQAYFLSSQCLISYFQSISKSYGLLSQTILNLFPFHWILYYPLSLSRHLLYDRSAILFIPPVPGNPFSSTVKVLICTLPFSDYVQ